MNLLDLTVVRLELGHYYIVCTGIRFLFVLSLLSSFPLPGFSGREASWLYIGV